MNFIVATHSSLLRIQVDSSWRLQDYQVLNSGYHYGITVLGNGHNKSGAGAQFVAYRGGLSVAEQTEPQLMVYEADGAAFRASGIIPMGELGDVHQIAYANEGIYVTDTKHNTLVYLGLETGQRHEYTFGKVRRDENHINSVYPCGAQVVVMLHNLRRKESQVAVLQHDLGHGFICEHLLSLWHKNCHNIFVDDQVLLYNASMSNELVVVDLQKDEIATTLSFDAVAASMETERVHIKGLSVIDDRIIVGVSEETIRDKRGTSISALAVIDRGSLSVVSTIDLHLPEQPQPVGNINEIRCLSSQDRGEQQRAPLNVDWANLSLAKNNFLSFLVERAKGKILSPAVRLKRRISIGKV